MKPFFIKDNEGFWFNINVIEHFCVKCTLNIEKKHEFIVSMRVNTDHFLGNSNAREISKSFDTKEEAQEALDRFISIIGES